MKKKFIKLWREFVSDKKYSETLSQISNENFVITLYRDQGIYALISRVSFLAEFLGKKRISEIYINLSNFIKDDSDSDRLLLSHLAFTYHPSEKNRRAYAWCCLRSGMYAECYKQIKILESLYATKQNVEIQALSIEKMKNSLKNRVGEKEVEKLQKKQTTRESSQNIVIEPLVLAPPDLKDENDLITFFEKTYVNNQFKSILQYVYDLDKDDKYKATLLVKIAKLLRERNDRDGALYLAKKAIDCYPSEPTARAAYWVGRHLGGREFCLECLIIIKEESDKKPNNKIIAANYAKLNRDYHNTFSELEVLNLLENISIDKDYSPKEGKVCYVLHNSFPYSSGGYATRGHGLLLGLQQLGLDIEVVNRPGFPYDIKDNLEPDSLPLQNEIDGINYNIILEPQRRGITSFEYMSQSVDKLVERFKELKPSLIMAASNYLTAFPAMIAAKRLGIPFIYEVRGFWEITRLSREPEFAKSPRFANQRRLETEVAEQADHVFTLTSAMKNELIDRGVTKPITLLPNSCNPEHFEPRAKDLALLNKLNIPKSVPVIGYIGTFVVYEGLEDLASACALLKEQGIEFRLLIVGNENATGLDRGPITQQIYDIAEKHNFSDWLIMPGRVPYEEVEAYYSLIDIAPFPRKPWPVCEMVSPMKPLEALAMEKIVVVSSVHALTEMIADGKTGRVFDKGDINSLATVLSELISFPDSFQSLGKNGRKWVLESRTWKKTSEKALNEIRILI